MSNSRKIKLPKPKVCRQCARGDHTGQHHAMCPRCGSRLEENAAHRQVEPGRWVCLVAGAN